MNAILELINSAGLKFVEFAQPMFVQSVVLIVILLLADFALRKKIRAVFRYWIWLLVLVKLVLPTSLSSPLSLGYFFGDRLTYVDTSESPAEPQVSFAELKPVNVPPFIDLTNIEADKFTPAAPPIIPEAEPAVTSPANAPAISVTPLSWQGAVFLVWLTVVMAMILLLLQRVIFVKGLVAQAKKANGVMADMLESCRSSMSVKRKLVLKISANAASPAVCGLFRPVILVPQNLASSLTTDQLRAVLLHELAHIRRGDLFVNLAQTVLQIIYFYHPLLWLANCIIRRIREQAVDEMVLVAMGEKAQQYPQTLVSVAKLAFNRPVLSLRLIGVVESKSALSTRIKHILNRPMPKKAKLGILGLLVVIITGAILLPMAKSMPGPPKLVIKGVVKDTQTNEPIAGARVCDDGYGPGPKWEQIRPDVRCQWGAITNSAGQYSFLTWPEHHTIKVEAPGYKAQHRNLYSGHFTLNKIDQEIFDFTLSSEFKTILPNGVTVELVGLFDSESKGQLTWWRPDGTAMSKQESKSYEYRINPDHIRNRDDWKFEYGYILKFAPLGDLSSMTDVTVGQKMRYKFPREDGLGVAYVESDEYQRTKGLAQTGEIRIAAAYGPSSSFSSEHRVGQDTDIFSLDDGSTIILSPTRPDRYEPDVGLMIDTTVNTGDVDIKVLYESKNGNIRKAWADGTTGGPSLVNPNQRSRTMIQQTFRLHSIAKEELKKIIVECRRFQGVTFKNVALKSDMKTKVAVDYIQPQGPVNAETATQADSIYPEEPASTGIKKPIAVGNIQPTNSRFTVDLDNSTSFELLGLTKFNGEDLKWWSPEGQPIELPSVTSQDIKHKGNIAAFRFYGPVDSFTGYYMIASYIHEIKEIWQVGSSGVWLGVLGYPQERNFGKLYFRTKGKPGRTLYTIPVTLRDIGKKRAINQYGVNIIQSFERIGSDGFAIELFHDEQLAGDEFAAVDKSGKMHEYTEGYSTRNRSYMKYKLPPEELAGIVRQKYSFSAVYFRNVSLQGEKTKVAIEYEKRDEPGQPRLTVDVNSKFLATMPNGVKVGLIALGWLTDGSLQWWKPDGQTTDIPGILECDIEGYDVVLAYKIQGSNGSTSYSIQEDQLQRIKSGWFVRSHGLWMVPLEKAPQRRVADFAVRAYGGPSETRLEIPLSEKDIGREIEISWLGYEKVAEFTAVTPDSFRVKINYSSQKRALGEFVAVDKTGKTHERVSGAVWQDSCRATFPISVSKLSHLALQRQEIGQATFRNISLQPGQNTKVQKESLKVDRLIPPSQAKWSVQDIKTDVQIDLMGGSSEIKVPQEMVGTWFFENPEGDDEQMSIFPVPDGRTVVIYHNGHRDESRYTDGFIQSSEHNNAQYKMTLEADGTLVQYFDSGGSLLIGKRWKRIDPQPSNNFLRVLTGPNSGKKAVDSGELTGRVVDETGNPIADAQVAISTEKIGVKISNGKLLPMRRGDIDSKIIQTDSQGRFNFGQKPSDIFNLIVAHEKGFAQVSSEDITTPYEVRIQPWGRIKGQLAPGRKAAGGTIALSSLPNSTWFVRRSECRYETKCDTAGSFVFDKLPPGWFEVGYLVSVGEASASITCRTPVEVEAGRTAELILGGTGRPVVGKFVPPLGYDMPIYFGNGLRALDTVRPERPYPDNYDQMKKREQQQWYKQWRKTDEYKKYRDAVWLDKNRRQYTFKINKDGSFRIEDVIAGEYDLTVWIEERLTGQGRPEEIADYDGTIEVPEIPGGRSDEPLDLSKLELTMHNPLRVGDIAPLFEAKTINGENLRLIDYRGKFVLLSFWQPVFHPELQQLKELYDTYSSKGRLEIIGLGGSDTLEEVKNYVKENTIPWPQIYTGEEFKSGIAKDYGGYGVFLIDPNGRVVAKNLRDEKLMSTVIETLNTANQNKTDLQVEAEGR